MLCESQTCQKKYPIYKGIPILINEENSLFRSKDFLKIKRTTLKIPNNTIIKSKIKKLIPKITRSINSAANYSKLMEKLKGEQRNILIIGGSIEGFGIDKLYGIDSYNIIESDVTHGPLTKIIFDCHDIPYENNVFDAIVCQAVLEHVLEPDRCVSEIHRVLKDDGYVYAETPFMQQVHFGAYDFTRYTYLGHRYLFKNFECIDSGMTHGPATALAWSIKYFFNSFFISHKIKVIVDILLCYLLFWLKYIDYLLIKRDCYDAALGFYFIGRKSNHTITGRELIKMYR